MMEVPGRGEISDSPYKRNRLKCLQHLLGVRNCIKGFNNFLSFPSQGSLLQRRKQGTEKLVNYLRSHRKQERAAGSSLRSHATPQLPACRESRGDSDSREKKAWKAWLLREAGHLPDPFQELDPLGFPYKMFLRP